MWIIFNLLLTVDGDGFQSVRIKKNKPYTFHIPLDSYFFLFLFFLVALATSISSPQISSRLPAGLLAEVWPPPRLLHSQGPLVLGGAAALSLNSLSRFKRLRVAILRVYFVILHLLKHKLSNSFFCSEPHFCWRPLWLWDLTLYVFHSMICMWSSDGQYWTVIFFLSLM